MKRMRLREFTGLLIIFLLGVSMPSMAQQTQTNVAEESEEMVDDSDLSIESEESAMIPKRRFNRNIDRIDYRSKDMAFIYKGEVIVGLAASHNSLSTDNAEYLTLLTDLTVEGHITTIKPYAAYFYRDNKAVGARFGYMGYGGTIDSATLDLGETNDLSFDVPYVDLSSINYTYSLFHRTYASLDRAGHFGVYAEMELSASHGESDFSYDNDAEIRSSHSKNQSYSLSFNPGITAFMLHNVSAALAFEFGGLNYTRIRQYDQAGEMVGSRDASSLKFMFNVFAVNFGITIHIW